MEAYTLRYQTDTVTPRTIVPVYFVHSIENPFCPLPGCWCKSCQEEIAKLLEYVRSGEMTLREAANITGIGRHLDMSVYGLYLFPTTRSRGAICPGTREHCSFTGQICSAATYVSGQIAQAVNLIGKRKADH